MHIAHQLNSKLTINAGFHYTYGRGYYEEFWQNEDLSTYGLSPVYYGLDSVENTPGEYEQFYHDTINSSDIVRRLWLDNDFYGTVWSIHYTENKISLILGGGINIFGNAKHYGEIKWASEPGLILPDHKFYQNQGEKKDYNIYGKAIYTILPGLKLYADLQVRQINYNAYGQDREYRNKLINIDTSFFFVNPKIGIQYNMSQQNSIYASFAMANREPTRNDMVDAPDDKLPKHETLSNIEAGIKLSDKLYAFEFTLYYMNYKNQLVLSGALDGVGAPIRENVGKSYRSGIEMAGGYQLFSKLSVNGNVTYSSNKTDYKIYDDAEGAFRTLKDVKISFSPSIIASGNISYIIIDNLESALIFKHVGKQYLDNTQNENLIIDAYSLLDFSLNYKLKFKYADHISINGTIHNVLDTEYASNGYVSYGYAYYYPQAGRHYMLGLTAKF